MRLSRSPYVHLYPTSLQICLWSGGLFFSFSFFSSLNSGWEQWACFCKQLSLLPAAAWHVHHGAGKTAKRWITQHGGKWAGWSQKQKTGTFFRGIVAHRSGNPEMMERFVVLASEPVVNWAGWGVQSTWRRRLEFFVSNPCWTWGLAKRKFWLSCC